MSFKPFASDDRRCNGENNEGLKIEHEDNEENVTPRDLMTFALQITQGMVSTADTSQRNKPSADTA